jgi:hypothetical protein
LDRTKFVGAFTAGLAATLLDYHDATKMARVVALYTQKAAHRKEWERRKSDLEILIEREREAVWQLERIVEKLPECPILL